MYVKLCLFVFFQITAIMFLTRLYVGMLFSHYRKDIFTFFFFLLPHQHFTSGLVLLKNSFVSSKLSWPWIRRIRGCRVSSCTCANHKLAGQLGDAVRLQTWWHAQFSDISQGTVSGEKKCLIWSSQAKINMKNKCKWKHFSPVMAANS